MRAVLSRSLGVLVLLVLAAGCVRNTRGAIRNTADGPITVLLKSADGKTTHTFADIAPNTTTAFQKLGFDELKGVAVEVTKGTAKGGKVDLKHTFDNVVVVGSDSPTLDAKENPDNTFW